MVLFSDNTASELGSVCYGLSVCTEQVGVQECEAISLKVTFLTSHNSFLPPNLDVLLIGTNHQIMTVWDFRYEIASYICINRCLCIYNS